MFSEFCSAICSCHVLLIYLCSNRAEILIFFFFLMKEQTLFILNNYYTLFTALNKRYIDVNYILILFTRLQETHKNHLYVS